MINLLEIYKQIELKKAADTMPATEENTWKPQRCEQYEVPPFVIPETRYKCAQRKKLSKVLAFIKMAQRLRFDSGCTIMPIATTNKRMIAIAGSVANASNLIKFMLQIGLISVESDRYRFNSKNEKLNVSKKYRYYYDNEAKVIKYCIQEDIKELTLKNFEKCNEKKLVAFPSGLPQEGVRFSSKLKIPKTREMSVSEMTDLLRNELYKAYPDFEKYQRLADEINEEYYSQYPEFAIRFRPNFNWNKGYTVIEGIGIRATNQCVSARNNKSSNKESGVLIKQELLDKHHFNLSKDVKSSVPRITLSINQHKWESEESDIYERIYEEYIQLRGCPTSDTVVQKFEELRPAIKALHMRRYFDDEKSIGNHTCHAMQTVENRPQVYEEMEIYRNAIVKAEGRKLYDSEIFYHESCIYLDVLKELLDNGFFAWECYDAFYARKEGVTQEEFERYVEAVVEEKANAYIDRYYQLKDAV